MRVYELSYATSYFNSGKFSLYAAAESVEAAVKAADDYLLETIPAAHFDLSWVVVLGKVIIAK